MSWLENIENIPFRITTGDGQVFNPLWISSEKKQEFNFSKYEFINLEKSLIDRRLPKSINYPLEFFFEGDDNLEQSMSFQESAKDRRAWTINHPFYGVIFGQPVSISVSDKKYNTSKFTVDFWETISEEPLRTLSVAENEISEKVLQLQILANENYANNVNITSEDISSLRQTLSATRTSIALLNRELENQIRNASSVIDSNIDNPLEFIRGFQDLVFTPIQIESEFNQKLNSVRSIFNSLLKDDFSRNDKVFFESQASSLIASFSSEIITNTSFTTRREVENASNELISFLDDFVEVIDNEQVAVFDREEAWAPNAELLRSVFDIVFFVTENLFSVAFESKQERIVEVEKDTNLIVLAHKFMGGLDVDDEKINTFRNINNIKNDELLLIKKGRRIIYYV